jgi:catechol 2,3-dioxygenase-like lactoylglutathione lyase family enzyme
MSSVVSELFDVTLRASNVEELSHFYSKLGLRRAVDDEDLKVFILGVNELEIHRDQTASEQAVTIRVQVDEIDRVQSSLRQQAIEFQQADQDERAVHVRDPNGNLVQFVTPKN